ncbi:hypothetical protein ACFS07_02620 [Undibacterium arcticum]
MRNTIIIETADALLIMDADSAQEAKKAGSASDRYQAHRSNTASRNIPPLGGRTTQSGPGRVFHVKRITVKQGAKLSLQMHHHRAEHWVVVSGTAKITNGDQEYLLTEKPVHLYSTRSCALAGESRKKIPLELIEIQSGAYLGEDDIVRLQDNYGRV